MKQLSRNYRMAAMLALCLMSASTEGSTGGTAPDTSAADAAKAEAKALKEQAAADKKAAAAKAKADKAEADKAAKAQKEQDAQAQKDAKAKEAADKKAAAEQAKVDKKAAAEQAKKDKAEAAAQAKADKAASKQPEQNGIRRPKPDSLCGKAWATMDALTAERGSTVTIAALLEATNTMGLNEGNVRAEYARWRKFNGVSGRIVDPKAAPAESGAGATA
jgi:FtsZ-interacting cell division protein ZipA